jgi:glycosyltransferase involved in cell wall biosynthesis
MNNRIMEGSLKTLLLFDPEVRHYRQPVYNFFQTEFKKHGYNLKVVYDKKLKDIQDDLFVGIDYTFANFNSIIKTNECRVIILFVWLHYKFLLPFMLYQRIKGIKTITWTHGINLLKKRRPIKNRLYYLRQRLAHALIIYSKNEKKYINASHKKLFIANNTLNFYDFPGLNLKKEELKRKYHLEKKKIILFVGRILVPGRKINTLIELAGKLDNNYKILVIGPGLKDKLATQIENIENIHYYGAVYDPVEIAEFYSLSDLFCMPGPIGLAINHAFYYGLPVVTEEGEHGPEITYLEHGKNGFLYKKNDIEDLKAKVLYLLENPEEYIQFSKNAKEIIETEASIENMAKGFVEAIKYAESR